MASPSRCARQTQRSTGLKAALLSLALGVLSAGGLRADPLAPGNFASLGGDPFTSPGTYTIDTSATPTLSGPGIVTPIEGEVSVDGIAVFTFEDITIAAGVTVDAAGTRPVALLSQDFFNMSGGTIDVSGAGGGMGGFGTGTGGTGGSGGAGGGAGGTGGESGSGGDVAGGAGSGPGGAAGGPGTATGDAGGGGFGGKGGDSTSAGGIAYGDLFALLEGGSGGGGGGGFGGDDDPFFRGGAGGGGGGGGVEIGATNGLTLGGSVLANGGGGADSYNDGGGGSGGGIFVHADTVTLSGSLSANGGAGGGTFGGGGGGGRIAFLTTSGTINNVGGSFSVAGGNSTIHGDGDPGVVTFAQVTTPTSLTEDLIDLVRSYGLPKGTQNSLVVKLQAALSALSAGDTATACARLQDFINHANAQKGKKLTAAQADELIDGASDIRTLLGCT